MQSMHNEVTIGASTLVYCVVDVFWQGLIRSYTTFLSTESYRDLKWH